MARHRPCSRRSPGSSPVRRAKQAGKPCLVIRAHPFNDFCSYNPVPLQHCLNHPFHPIIQTWPVQHFSRVVAAAPNSPLISHRCRHRELIHAVEFHNPPPCQRPASHPALVAAGKPSRTKQRNLLGPWISSAWFSPDPPTARVVGPGFWAASMMTGQHCAGSGKLAGACRTWKPPACCP